jgi:hypothetical protein
VWPHGGPGHQIRLFGKIYRFSPCLMGKIMEKPIEKPMEKPADVPFISMTF